MLEKRVNMLEREVKTLRATVLRLAKPTKLPANLRAALTDMKAGRTSGPFRSADALMKHLGA